MSEKVNFNDNTKTRTKSINNPEENDAAYRDFNYNINIYADDLAIYNFNSIKISIEWNWLTQSFDLLHKMDKFFLYLQALEKIYLKLKIMNDLLNIKE